MKRYLLLTITLLISVAAWSQQTGDVIQFSGRVLDEKGEVPLFTSVSIKGTARGTVIGADGFFSMPVRESDTLQFSRIGYELLEYVLPSQIENDYLSKNFVLIKDTLYLPEAMVYPWPDKDFFEIEFLALEVDNTLEDVARENLSAEKLAVLAQVLPVDGGEVSKIELRQIAQAYYSAGQFKPQQIFNPLSWKKFIDAIRNGDFKKKKK